MHSPNLSGKQLFAVALTIGLGLSHYAACQAGFEKGQDPLRLPAEPGRVPCGPQWGLHQVQVEESIEGIAGQYGAPAFGLAQLNGLVNAQGTPDATGLIAGRCLRIRDNSLAPTATPPGEFVGTPVGFLR